MAWIRSQDGSLYNLAYIVSLRVEGGEQDGEAVDLLIARLVDGNDVELGHSAYGVDEDALAEAIEHGAALIDVVRDGVIDACDDEGTAEENEADEATG